MNCTPVTDEARELYLASTRRAQPKLLGLSIGVMAEGAVALCFEGGVPVIPHEAMLAAVREWWGLSPVHAFRFARQFRLV